MKTFSKETNYLPANLKVGDLLVWHIPQVPMNAFYVIGKTWLEFIEDVMKAVDAVTPDAIKPVTFPKAISQGEKGEHVVALQAFLRKLGFFTYSTDTGNYFEVTAESVRTFQRAYGLPVTGQFDEVTRTKANAIAGK